MSDLDPTLPLAVELAPAPPASIGAWLRQGTRSAVFLRPDWRGLHTSPTLVALLISANLAIAIVIERLLIVGPAHFYAPALLAGWLPTLVTAWACWLLVPIEPSGPGGAPDAMALFTLNLVQAIVLWLVLAAVQIPLTRSGAMTAAALGAWGLWIAWFGGLAWGLAVVAWLLWHGSRRSVAVRATAIALVCGATLAGTMSDPMRLWYADEPAGSGAGPMRLTQEAFEDQAATLDLRLAALLPQRPGVVDVYAITFAPYADEDVFMRESRMVAEVMAARFGASGRTLQLVNHRSTQRDWPWATTLNLQRAIEHIARRMNRDEDMLFIHLTSHGAHSGSLEARFWPLSTEALTPAMLKAMLDAAGIRHRIVSVSACYSGSWIEPLAGDDTLVMSAADADHTSYGCGRGSELTYFGRAMFDEQLRSKTLSFEAAHAAARTVIEQREKEAGKSDGYSNPQIRIGNSIRPLLLRLERERAASAQ